MQAFSSTVRDFYALAEYASPEQFLAQALPLLQTWIRFDGAIFGTGEASERASLHAPMNAQDPILVNPSDSVTRTRSSPDAVAQGFRDAPLAPSRGGIRELYRKSRDGKANAARGSGAVKSLAEELGLCHLIVHGDDPAKVHPARWIVLYRQHDVRFAEADAACLHSLWTHLSAALSINRSRVAARLLASQAKPGSASASGLIHEDGTVEIADPAFFELLEREWPELAPDFIPPDVLEILNTGKSYKGGQIEIGLTRHAEGMLCRIRAVDAMEILSPREFVVARRFAAGMSHKQIARELGVSHHTVRNQLAHLYRKLDLHDKASLAQYLSRNVGAY